MMGLNDSISLFENMVGKRNLHMSGLKQLITLGLLGLLITAFIGCNMVPQRQFAMSQIRSRQLYQQNQQMAVQNQQLEQQVANLNSSLQTANSRLSNLNAERSDLQQRYVSMLRNGTGESPLSDATTRRFEELSRKYKDFEFDPATGVSKFHSDILFDSGSDKLKTDAVALLHEFADIMNADDAGELNILVVGHTDNKKIKRGPTKAIHPTNWHLSTNRANSVVLQLAKGGISEYRMGTGGYGKHQPVSDNLDETGRSQNRRVEIFVLAPDAVVANWDPNTSLN